MSPSDEGPWIEITRLPPSGLRVQIARTPDGRIVLIARPIIRPVDDTEAGKTSSR